MPPFRVGETRSVRMADGSVERRTLVERSCGPERGETSGTSRCYDRWQNDRGEEWVEREREFYQNTEEERQRYGYTPARKENPIDKRHRSKSGEDQALLLDDAERRLGVTLTGKVYACGGFGCVAPTTDGRVIKVTRDLAEVRAVNAVKDQEAYQGFARIDTRPQLFDPELEYTDDDATWFYLREDVTPLRQVDRDVWQISLGLAEISWATDTQRHYPGSLATPGVMAMIEKKWNLGMEKLGKVAPGVASTLRALRDRGTLLTDLRFDNAGRRKSGEVVLFDAQGVRASEERRENPARRPNPHGSDWRHFERELRHKGWRVERAGSGHLKLYSPGGQCLVVASSSPSDQRAMRNLEADVRRCERREEERRGNPVDTMAVWYHGTSEASARAALARGSLWARETAGRGRMDPLEGRIYMTRDLGTALAYAFGGMMAGHDPWEGERWRGRGAVLEVIPGAECVPDEDWVGLAISEALRRDANPLHPEVIPAGNVLVREIPASLSARWSRYDRYKLAEASVQSSMGKAAIRALQKTARGRAVLDTMTTHAPLLACDQTSRVVRGWSFDKRDSKRFDPSGANFFELAAPLEPELRKANPAHPLLLVGVGTLSPGERLSQLPDYSGKTVEVHRWVPDYAEDTLRSGDYVLLHPEEGRHYGGRSAKHISAIVPAGELEYRQGGEFRWRPWRENPAKAPRPYFHKDYAHLGTVKPGQKGYLDWGDPQHYRDVVGRMVTLWRDSDAGPDIERLLVLTDYLEEDPHRPIESEEEYDFDEEMGESEHGTFFDLDELPALVGSDVGPDKVAQVFAHVIEQLAEFEMEDDDFGLLPLGIQIALVTDALEPEQRDRLRLVPVSKEEAFEFIQQHHSAFETPNYRGLLYAMGAAHDGRLVAVATIVTPAKDFPKRAKECPWDGIVELSRIASDGSVKFASSMLCARALELLEVSGRRGQVGCLFVTYSLATERGTTYTSLANRGLRPVSYNKGKKSGGGGTRAKGDARAGEDKIRWEYGPGALHPDWDVLRRTQASPEQIERAALDFADWERREQREREQLAKRRAPRAAAAAQETP